jgi:hypothetical protein
MAVKLSGWYAFFQSTASYEIFHGSEYHQRYPKDKADSARDLIHFRSLREARAYLYMHFNGEISDARYALKQIRSIKSEGRR